jgi:hypothetical protein
MQRFAEGNDDDLLRHMMAGDEDAFTALSKVIEGIQAEGKRFTETIPAGRIGNDKPIEIINESWFSPELQTVVMSKHSDPRSGDVVYTLTNIQRVEPDPALFQVPADYKMREEPAGELTLPRIRRQP